ncbi:MAG TPA: hypothetical protein VEX38_09445 [Fimbriimonadaceae bacterium]|nr:hypothetical protein [Fimbriimonadaceae bacterium]
MPAEVYRDSVSSEIDLVEAIPLSQDSPDHLRHSYPYPALQLSGEKRSLEFHHLVLENSLVRYAFAPELGGRLLSITDKRTGSEIWPISGLGLSQGGPRGVVLERGMELLVGENLNSLGPVEVQIAEPEDAEEPAGLCFAELASGLPLSYHVFYHLPPDTCVVSAEVRVFNRSLVVERYSAGLRIHQLRATHHATAAVYYDQGHDSGLAVLFEEGEFVGADASTLFRAQQQELVPGQLDVWRFSLTPFSGLSSVPSVGPGASIVLETEAVRVQAHRRLTGAKLIVQTPNGALEAPADLYPERIFEASVAGLNATGAVLIDAERGESARSDRQAGGPTGLGTANLAGGRSAYESAVTLFDSGASPAVPCQQASRDLGFKGPAYQLLGFHALRSGAYVEAASSFENALLFNAEDHLAWWGKALAQRLHSNEEDPASPELPNAHFLAPLEPLLRAEAFLAQNNTDRAPNPLIKPLADSPDAMVEVGCWLYRLKLYEQLAKWVDEALRHREIPMLRYLLADALLSQSRMAVEAAEHVRAAAQAPVNPPYPWRATERLVLERLTERFPTDSRIRDLLSLMDWAGA